MPKTKILKFGVEIEGEFGTILSEQISDSGIFKHDGSIRSCPASTPYHDKHGALIAREFVTEPIERNKLAQTKSIFDKLHKAYKEGDFHWNESCGLHIHVSFFPQMPPEIFSSQFCMFFYDRMKEQFPKAYERRKENRYCRATFSDEEIRRGIDRYRGINLKPAFQKHKTIEFRIFPASTPSNMYKYLYFTIITIEDFLKLKVTIPYEIDLKNEQPIVDAFDRVLFFKEQVMEYNYKIGMNQSPHSPVYPIGDYVANMKGGTTLDLQHDARMCEKCKHININPLLFNGSGSNRDRLVWQCSGEKCKGANARNRISGLSGWYHFADNNEGI